MYVGDLIIMFVLLGNGQQKNVGYVTYTAREKKKYEIQYSVKA